MKKTPFLLLVFGLLTWACSTDSESDDSGNRPIPEARTPIPDANFEAALVELDLDDSVDGSVLTSRIESVQNLNVSNKGIENLSGIEGFKALVDLNVRENSLRSINISGNTDLLFLWAADNELTQLVIGNNPNIEKVELSGNRISSLNVSEYTTLQLLDVRENEITGIDVSTLPLPTFNEFRVEGNPLTCILVSPEQLEAIPASWTKDAEDSYSLDCE